MAAAKPDNQTIRAGIESQVDGRTTNPPALESPAGPTRWQPHIPLAFCGGSRQSQDRLKAAIVRCARQMSPGRSTRPPPQPFGFTCSGRRDRIIPSRGRGQLGPFEHRGHPATDGDEGAIRRSPGDGIPMPTRLLGDQVRRSPPHEFTHQTISDQPSQRCRHCCARFPVGAVGATTAERLRMHRPPHVRNRHRSYRDPVGIPPDETLCLPIETERQGHAGKDPIDPACQRCHQGVQPSAASSRSSSELSRFSDGLASAWAQRTTPALSIRM